MERFPALTKRNMSKLNIHILGMHCTSCAQNIEKTLKNEVGINKISVNYASEKAFIEFDQEKINQGKILKIISDLGYRGIIGESGESEESESRRLLIRFWILLIISIPLFLLAMMVESTLPNRLVQLLLGSAAVIAAKEIWISGFKGLVRLAPTMDSLIFIGTAVAYIASVFYLFQFNQELYFETVSFVLMFITLGKYLEAKSKGQASEAIKKLMGLQPKEATVLLKEKDERIINKVKN